MDRRGFLEQALGSGLAAGLVVGERPSAPLPAAPAQFELDELTVRQLADGMAAGRWTARGLAERYLARIDTVDRAGPALRSVIETNPDALELADRLDAERKSRGSRGPLHGIPVLVKDNLDSGDRMQTTAGSLALAGAPAPRDSTVVARLREAGAVLLGKTNLSEWANYRSTTSTSGWSGRGGLTRHPYVLDRNACGSSSGSGTAAAASLAAVTIGTETDGSVVCPASICGLVGIKPTVGLVSRAGIIPISATQDTAGPMCRTVEDAALVLAAIQGFDQRDPATVPLRGHPPADPAAGLRADALRGKRLGIVRKGFDLPRSVEPVLADAIGALRELGATVLDPVVLPHLDQLGEPETLVLDYEFKAGLASYFAARGAAYPVKGLEALIRFNANNRERELPWFGQEIFERAVRRGPLSDPAYRSAKQTCHRLAGPLGIDAVLARLRLDALVAITAGPAWPTDLVNGDRYTGGCSTPPAVAGYPHVTVPAGAVHELPIGLSFFGPAWSEPRLIGFAYAFERSTNARRRPRFLPSL